MIEQILSGHRAEFEKVLEHFARDLNSVRTGRANPGLLATVMVESYGARMPLEHVASVTVSDAKTLVVSPWDKSQLPAVDKAIQSANLGFNPSNDGNILRISLPPMSEERRREMVRMVGQIAEKARIGIRNARELVVKELKKAESEGNMSEDDLAKGQKKLQELVDGYNTEVKTMAEQKEQEVMTV